QKPNAQLPLTKPQGYGNGGDIPVPKKKCVKKTTTIDIPKDVPTTTPCVETTDIPQVPATTPCAETTDIPKIPETTPCDEDIPKVTTPCDVTADIPVTATTAAGYSGPVLASAYSNAFPAAALMAVVALVL
ncbi:hypothetical protein HDV01_000559, partial [Terramyces sp. JEL0728]